ncbi:MAG TPA: hypothetical protein VEJ18_20270, partial [Planctomycetota bacterium]|nr:hypothetical protein [Planctomycetota bacterium]
MNPSEIMSGRWFDPKANESSHTGEVRGLAIELKAATPQAYRALCQAQLAKGWTPLEPYPVDAGVLGIQMVTPVEPARVEAEIATPVYAEPTPLPDPDD